VSDKVTFESSSVGSYLGILQDVIGRMASNSSACKAWCVTLVSAVVVVVADKGKPRLVWIAVIPVFLFLFLDAYYLSLEKQFRETYNDFIRKVHFGSATVEDVFYVAPREGVTRASSPLAKAMGSTSIWPFYSLLVVMLVVLIGWVL